MGTLLLARIATMPRWCLYRQTFVRFMDDRTFRLTGCISIDAASAIDPLNTLDSEDGSAILPIALLDRGAPYWYQCSDESGKRIPIISHEEVDWILVGGLTSQYVQAAGIYNEVELARSEIEEAIDPENDFEDILARIEKRIDLPSGAELLRENLRLRREQEVVAVQLPRDVVDKIYLIHESRVPLNRKPSEGYLNGGRTEFGLKCGFLCNARASELVIEAPTDMNFEDCALVDSCSYDHIKSGVKHTDFAPDVQYYQVNGPSLGGRSLCCIGRLRLRPTAFVRSAVYTSWLSCLVSLIIAITIVIQGEAWAPMGVADSESLVAILALLPASVGAYLGQRSPHVLTTTALFSTRLSVWFLGAVVFIGSFTIALDMAVAVSAFVWGLVATLNGLVAIRLSLQLRSLRLNASGGEFVDEVKVRVLCEESE